MCAGSKFDYWYVDNLRHMIDNFSGLEYDTFEVLTESKYGGVYDKLQMFDKFRTRPLYFDLDVVITGDCNKFLTKNLTVCNWREDYHSPINSNIISWRGDQSHVFELFDKIKIDLRECTTEALINIYIKILTIICFTKASVLIKKLKNMINNIRYIFNQNYEVMRWKSWCQKYLLAQRT